MSKEYVPNTEEALKAYKKYKKHQLKLKFIPFYRRWHYKKTIKQLNKLTAHPQSTKPKGDK